MSEWINPQLFLGERIGSGGMAEVFRGCQILPGGLERQVAVKRLYQHRSTGNIRALFKREAELYSHLNHPNIVQVFSTLQSGENFVIVMEFIAGKTLLAIWSQFSERGKRVPVALAAYIIREAARGLHHAHSVTDPHTGKPLGVVHRDVSHENIIVGFNGQVKVLDFGIGKAINQTAFTKTGVLKGKLRYLAPESVQNEIHDARTDIYSLGVVLWELLADRELVDGEFTPRALHQIVSGEIPLLAPERADLPQRVDEILRRALAKNPMERYQTALEFAEALDTVLPALSSTVMAQEFSDSIALIFPEAVAQEREAAGRLKEAVKRELMVRPVRSGFQRIRKFINPGRPLVKIDTRIKVAVAVILLVLNVLHFASGTAASSAAFVNPMTMAHLAAWYKVDAVGSEQGRSVGRWIDRGPRHFDALQPDPLSQPKLTFASSSDIPVLHFDGERSSMSVPEIAAAARKSRGFSVILMGRITGQQTHYFWSLQQDRTTDIARLGGHLGKILFTKSTSIPGSVYDYSKPSELDTFAVLAFVMDRGSARLYRNGELAIDKQLDEIPDLKAAGEFSIGQRFKEDAPVEFLHGDIAEMLFFDTPLGDEARKNVELYLADKFSKSIGKS